MMNLQQTPTTQPPTKAIVERISRSHSTPTPLIPQQQDSQETPLSPSLSKKPDSLFLKMEKTADETWEKKLLQQKKIITEALPEVLTDILNPRLSHYHDKIDQRFIQQQEQIDLLKQEIVKLNNRLDTIGKQRLLTNTSQPSISSTSDSTLKYFAITFLIILGAGALLIPAKVMVLCNHIINQSTTS